MDHPPFSCDSPWCSQPNSGVQPALILQTPKRLADENRILGEKRLARGEIDTTTDGVPRRTRWPTSISSLASGFKDVTVE